MKRGRGMRQEEYSTTGARKQEALGGQGLSIGGFLSGLGKIRGASAPSAHAGVFGKEKKEEGKGLIVHAEAKSSSRRRQCQPVQLRRESNGRSSHSGRPPFGSAFH